MIILEVIRRNSIHGYNTINHSDDNFLSVQGVHKEAVQKISPQRHRLRQSRRQTTKIPTPEQPALLPPTAPNNGGNTSTIYEDASARPKVEIKDGMGVVS